MEELTLYFSLKYEGDFQSIYNALLKKERVDVLCVEQGLFESREKAKRAIMAGIVRDDYDYIDKPGTKIPIDSHLFIKGEKLCVSNTTSWR